MKSKRLKSMFAVVLACSMSAACAVPAIADDGVTLEVETGVSGNELENFRGILAEFTEETGIEIELVTPGADYEPVLKTRMAANDMPDVFVTHGWSILRYKEFLREVNDQPFVEKYEDSIIGAITDEEGKIYVNCVTQCPGGYVYNKDVLDKAGVDPDQILTMNDFLDACEKVKAIGVTPFNFGGKDVWTLGRFVNFFAPVFYTADGCTYPSKDKLLDGTFDWETDGKYFFEFVKTLVERGYTNEDLLTDDSMMEAQAIANGECAFTCGSSYNSIVQYNPDVVLGVNPMPALEEDGKMYFSMGEGSAFGVWKDSEHVEEGLELLNFLARPEIAGRVAEGDNYMPALTDAIPPTTNEAYKTYGEAIDKFAENIYFDIPFDIAYLPSGMWMDISDAMVMVLVNPTDEGVEEACEFMQTNYTEKYAADREE